MVKLLPKWHETEEKRNQFSDLIPMQHFQHELESVPHKYPNVLMDPILVTLLDCPVLLSPINMPDNQCVIMLNVNVHCLQARKLHLGCDSLFVDSEIVLNIFHTFHCKKQKHHCNLFRPIPFCMEKKSTSTESQAFNFTFNNCILMMSANTTKSEFLIHQLAIIQKRLLTKISVVSMTM